MVAIEFTDRYGGDPPSWLRGCHDHCEATGYVPVFMAPPVWQDDHAYPPEETDSRLIDLWKAAEAEKSSDDGWHFVECPSCRGTGRVNFLRSVARLPRWIVKGAGFMRQARYLKPDSWSWPAHLWLMFKCAYLYDIGWKR